MNMVLGFQWLYSTGKYSTNYQTLEMEFQALDGKSVVLNEIPNEASKLATKKGMTTIFRHEERARAKKCPTPTQKVSRRS